MFLLFVKRSIKIPQIDVCKYIVEDLLKPFKNYGAKTLKNIFSRFELSIDSSIINPFVMETPESYRQRGR